MSQCEKVCAIGLVAVAVGITAMGFTSFVGGEVLGLYDPSYRQALTKGRFGQDMSTTSAMLIAVVGAINLGFDSDKSPWCIGIAAMAAVVGIACLAGGYGPGGIKRYTPDLLAGLAVYGLTAAVGIMAGLKYKHFHKAQTDAGALLPLLTEAAGNVNHVIVPVQESLQTAAETKRAENLNDLPPNERALQLSRLTD